MKYLFSILVISFLITSCSSQGTRNEEVKNWMTQNEQLRVLTTTAIIKDLVDQVGGSHIKSIALIKGELDPHSYQLVKGDDEKLRAADLIFVNGLGLEHGASLQQHLQYNPKVVELGTAILKNNPEQTLYYNGQVDPHIWMDISIFAEAVPFITAALSEKDPAHREEFEERGKQLQKQMLTKHEEVKKILALIPSEKRYLVTSHDAFNYFARAYLADENENIALWQQRFAAPEGLAPDSQLNPLDIQLIVDHLKRHNIAVLFPESNVSRDSIRKIVDAGREKGLNVVIASDYLYGDAMGRPGTNGDTYLKMIEHNAETIARYLNSHDNK